MDRVAGWLPWVLQNRPRLLGSGVGGRASDTCREWGRGSNAARNAPLQLPRSFAVAVVRKDGLWDLKRTCWELGYPHRNAHGNTVAAIRTRNHPELRAPDHIWHKVMAAIPPLYFWTPRLPKKKRSKRRVVSPPLRYVMMAQGHVMMA
jgi:hypothetical protein